MRIATVGQLEGGTSKMPEHVNLHWDDAQREWVAYVTSYEAGCYRLQHRDIDPPDHQTLVFAAHRDEIMELLNSGRSPALTDLVQQSMSDLKNRLDSEYADELKRKHGSPPEEEESLLD